MRAGTGGMYGWKGSILLEEKKGIDQDKKKKKEAILVYLRTVMSQALNQEGDLRMRRHGS